MQESNKLFVTTPIYYVNGFPHLGTAYSSVVADIISKFYREIMEYSVFTSFGTDEHGQKIENSALKADMDPQNYVDQAHKPFVKLLDHYNIHYSRFMRTTDTQHIEAAKFFWNKLCENGFIYESNYSGWYAESDEAYYKIDEIKDNRSIATGSKVEFIEEKCMFFNLQKVKNRLLQYYIENPSFILPEHRYNEALNIVKSNLPDLAISRSKFSWGIPVPGYESQVMYVWFEALINYLSVLGFPKNQDLNSWWRNSVHVIGKDILKFHAVYWPAMLLAVDMTPPRKIYAHGWLKIDDQKMSKSIGNVIDPCEVADSFGVDPIRYFFAGSVSYSEDTVFSNELLENIFETELINEVGNLVHRVLSMCYAKYMSTISFDALICDNDEMMKCLQLWESALKQSKKHMIDFNVHDYVASARHAVINTNKCINDLAPWNIKDPSLILGMLCLCLQRALKIYHPVIPTSVERMMHNMNIHSLDELQWNIHVSRPIQKPKVVFEKSSSDQKSGLSLTRS